MAASRIPVPVPANSVVDIYDATGIAVGTPLIIQNVSEVTLHLSEDDTAPLNTSGLSKLNPSLFLQSPSTPIGAWVVNETNASSAIQVEVLTDGAFKPPHDFPDKSFSGLRALNTQNYIESNIKLGVQHEGSTLLIDVAGGGSSNTIFLTGALPVSLKSRNIGYTGTGVSTFIYELPTYTGGTSVPYQNPNAINPVAGLAQIIVGASITDDGTLVFAPEHLLGPTSQTGKGASTNLIGQEKIMKANTAYLFRLTSLDAQVQDITSLLSWYEGELDLPLI